MEVVRHNAEPKGELELVKLLKSVNCQLLKTGYKTQTMLYYFCSCDPDQKEPICEECMNVCHKDHEKVTQYLVNSICSCGIKCHRINSQSNQQDITYQKKCLFMEWSRVSGTNIYYQRDNSILCMFCANFCEDNLKGNSKSSNPNINPNSPMINDDHPNLLLKRRFKDEEKLDCQCESKNHLDVKNIYGKIKEFSKMKDYNFEYFTPVHIVNLIIKSEICFSNIYNNFISYMMKLRVDLEDVNFFFDGNIAYSAAMQSMGNFSILADSCTKHYYFNENLENFLETKFIMKLMEKKFDYKSLNIWILKNQVFTMYQKFIIKRDWTAIPKLTINDIENISPIQRLIFASNVDDDFELSSNYIQNLKMNLLDNVLNLIEKLNNVKEKHEGIIYEILKKCYQICKTYARYNKFKHEQLLKFCMLNDEVVFKCAEAIKNMHKDKHAQYNLVKAQFRMMSSMAKSILFLVYYQNDQILESFLRSKREISKVNFFHSNSEVGKLVNKNCINILNFVRYQKRLEETKEMKKLMKKVLVYSTKITAISINYPDFYLIGLRRLMDKNNELYLNYLSNNFTSSEKTFLDFVKTKTSELEATYSNYFNFQLKENELVKKVVESIKGFFDHVGLPNFNSSCSEVASNYFENSVALKENREIYLIAKDDRNTKKVYPISKTVYLESSLANTKKREIENVQSNELKLKILINKSNFLFTVVKSLSILSMSKDFQQKTKEETAVNNSTVDDVLFEEVIRFLYYYIEDNVHNCMFILTSPILKTFENIGKCQIGRFMEYLHHVLHMILKNNVELTGNKDILRVTKKIIIKISGDPEYVHLLEKAIKILKLITDIQFVNEDYTHSKLRGMLKIFFEKNPVLNEFKLYLINQSSFGSNIITNTKETNNNLDNSIMPNHVMKKDFTVNNERNVHVANPPNEKKNDIDISPDDSGVIEDRRKKNATSATQSADFKGYKMNKIFNVYIKFLRLCNFLFDGNATLDETEFLKCIIKNNEIPLILRKRDLDLSLRIEILKFFRMVFIDVIINQEKLTFYRSLFVNPINIAEEGGLYDDGYVYKFFHDLLDVNSDLDNMSLESSVLKYELKFFQQIIEESKCKSGKKILDFIENGIILPLYVFLNKFMSIIYNLKGYEYLKLYEIVVYFLRLKKFLVEKKDIYEQKFNLEFKNIFKTYLNKRTNFSMINSGFSNEELIEVLKDIDEMNKPHFEILNYKTVYSFFEKHITGFIVKPKTKSLKEIFQKRDEHYTDAKIKKMENKLKNLGLMKTQYEKKIFDIIIKYENDKSKFSESAFVQNLGEQNIQYDANYRSIVLRTVFFLVNDPRFAEEYRSQNFWNLFKLLQYDTVPTQTEIYALYIEKAEILSFGSIMDLFLKNLLSLIFASCNPSTTNMNEDYYISMTIIKIMKYLCEEHNVNFQRIFFQELKFDYIQKAMGSHSNDMKQTLSLFDFMLGILGKIVILSKWEKVKFGQDDKTISYFYDLFFVIIELLIEMVQGTEASNLEGLLKAFKEREEDNFPFLVFLQSVKNLLLRDKNDSKVVYKVRKDIIDFIVAFLEEKSTPKKLIMLISSVYNPYTIFETIINTLKKLYIKFNSHSSVKDYKNDIFDHKKCDYFVNKYFSDLSFCETPEFEFANRMYQYVKLLACLFENEDASNIIESIKSYEESQLINLYTKKYKKKVDLNDANPTEVVLDESYIQNYFAVKFFEKITRSAHIRKDANSNDVMVLFTLNPLIPFLSTNTKNEFFNYVNRETRYTKLYSLMEYCDYFYHEIKYNSTKSNRNRFMKYLNKINYYWLEAAVFLITLIINIIMIASLEYVDLAEGMPDIFPAIKGLAIVQIIFNSIFLLIWMYSKFPLYYLIERKKYSSKRKIEIEEISVLQNFSIILYHAIFLKNEINGFIWNIVFSSIGIVSPMNTFLFSIQLLIIINLSITLKNIIKSVTLRYKQLLTTAMFVVIMLYVFACIAFFFLSDDFIFTIEGVYINIFINNFLFLESRKSMWFFTILFPYSFGLRT